MGSKFKRLYIIKNFIQNFFSKKISYPCDNCIVLPGGCSQICDKVEMNKLKLIEHFEKNFPICPDCGNELSLSDDGFFHGDNRYRQCKGCRHFFTITYYKPAIPYADIMRKKSKIRIINIDRLGH